MKDPQQVREYFTRSAVTFDSLYSEQEMTPLVRFINRKFRRDIYERFLRTMEHVRKHEVKSVLDIGCGSGRYAVGLAESGAQRIVGVDFSSNMINLAVEATKNIEGAEGIFEFACCDFMKFQTEERFDVVIAMGVFDYIKAPVPFLKKMCSFSNHSVLISFPSVSFYRTPIRKVRYYFKRCPLYFYKRNQIHSICSEAGFSEIHVDKIRGAGMDYFAVLHK